MKNTAIIIPTRLGAQRFPNKPLAKINNLPMIIHGLNRAKESKVGEVFVATPDKEIIEVVKKNGGKAVLTEISHSSGSDRVFEAVERFDENKKYDLVVNLQGDMPLINPKIIKNLVKSVQSEEITSLVSLAKLDDIKEESNVKVAISWDKEKNTLKLSSGKALFFSRLPIPHNAKNYWHHIGVYAWKRDALFKFVQSPQSDLEVSENLEQLRALEIGMSIRVIKTDFPTIGVDTFKDLEKVRSMISKQNI